MTNSEPSTRDIAQPGTLPESQSSGRSEKDIRNIEAWIAKAVSAGIRKDAIVATLVGSGWSPVLVDLLVANVPEGPAEPDASAKSSAAARIIVRRPPVSIGLLAVVYMLLAVGLPAWAYFADLAGSNGVVIALACAIVFAMTARSLLLSGKIGIAVTYVIAWTVVILVAIPIGILAILFS